MRVLLAAVSMFASAAAAQAPGYRITLAPVAGFDLADFDGPRQSTPLRDHMAVRRYLAPDIGDPPGFTRKPAMVRIRGRKVKLRIPLG